MPNTRFVLIRNVVMGCGLAAASWGGSVWAADYYVDQKHPSASDSNPGSEDAPWATLQQALRAPLQPGDTVYVKAGTYTTTGGQWNVPALNLPSGAQGKRITFKSLPAHAAVLRAAGEGAPIGVAGRKHVVIDGFVISDPGAKGIAVFDAEDVVIQNNVISGAYTGSLDNTEGVRIERSGDVLVRNNKITNVHNGGNSSNASAVKTYLTRNVTIENNEFSDVVAGVKEKEGSRNLTVRNNRMASCKVGLVLNNQNNAVVENVRFYQNIVQCDSGYDTESESPTIREVYIYNNTFAGYSAKAVHGTTHGQSLYVYNNIFYRGAGQASMADFFTRKSNTSEIKRMDFNLWNDEPKIIVGLYSSNTTYSTLQAWQAATGLSAHDGLGDPMFVNPQGGDFHLAAGSPAAGAGRVGGVESGAPVDLGAYPTGTEVVGLLSGEAGAAPEQVGSGGSDSGTRGESGAGDSAVSGGNAGGQTGSGSTGAVGAEHGGGGAAGMWGLLALAGLLAGRRATRR